MYRYIIRSIKGKCCRTYIRERRVNYGMVRRGEIYYADLRGVVVGSEQGGIRPVLILQNDIGNKYSPTTIIAAITSRGKKELPTHVQLHMNEVNGLSKDSIVLLEQIKTIDKKRIKERIGKLSDEEISEVKEALMISVAI